MKKYIYGALIGGILFVLVLSTGGNTNGAPIFAYVYSNSMEPLIRVNDAFFVLPSSKLQVGDIIMYRPVVLPAIYITHRIIAINENGYITKGDNSDYKDQESGEPEVEKERIVGKVVTIHGQPLIIPSMGRIPVMIGSGLGKNSIYLSGSFFMLGLCMMFLGRQNTSRRHKAKRRVRLGQIYKGTAILAALLIMLSIYWGSRVTQIKYLVSEYPGTLGDQVEVNQPDDLTMVIKNKGLVPVWSMMKGIQPLSVPQGSEYISSGSSKTILIHVLPQRKTGVYQGYVQTYNYPAFLPKKWVSYLHGIHPVLAILTMGLLVYGMFSLFFLLLSKVHGLEAFLPLKAVKDKMLKRRIHRGRGKLLGRRRSRW